MRGRDEPMTCWMGIDYGGRRTGIAVGHTDNGVTVPVGMLLSSPEPPMLVQIKKLAEEYSADGIVVGWPVNMDGTEGPQGLATRLWAERLVEATDLDVRLWDERLSSFQADDALRGHFTRKKRRARQDAVAAAGFLREFLLNDGPRLAKTPDDFET